MRSAQGVYPICEDDDTALAFVDFIHTRDTAILWAAWGPRAPQCYISLMEGARSHMTKIGSAVGVMFIPDSHAMTPGKAKHFFPGFTIRFLEAYSFTNSAGTVEILTQRDYQG